MPILFSNSEKEINNFIEKEKNGNDIKESKEKLIIILDELKNLGSFCIELDEIIKKMIISDKNFSLFIK